MKNNYMLLFSYYFKTKKLAKKKLERMSFDIFFVLKNKNSLKNCLKDEFTKKITKKKRTCPLIFLVLKNK
jgi:hypothetical protein